MSTPIVYLDTQDYSKFADMLAGRGHNEIKPIFEDLLAKIDAKQIIVAYSMPIVAELLRDDPGFRDLALRKAQLLERLTHGNTFLYPGDILELQLLRFAESRKIIPTDKSRLVKALSDNNRWFPQTAGRTFSNMRSDMIRETLRATGFIGQSRQHRRQLERKLSDQLKNVDPAAALSDPQYASLLSQFPVDRAATLALLKGVYADKLTDDQITSALFAAVTKPTGLVRWYYDAGQTNAIPYWLSSVGETFSQAIKGTAEKLKEELLKLHGEIPDDVSRRLQKFMSDRSLETACSILRRVFSGSSETSRISDSLLLEILAHDEIRSLPFVQFLVTLLPRYIGQAVSSTTSVRLPKRSDVGDIAHGFYIPYCAVWRSDRYFGDLVRNYGEQVRCEVVGRLLDLPAAIDRVIARS